MANFMLFICIFIPLAFLSGLAPTTQAIDYERSQLLKEAVSWMTFRKDGELVSDSDLQSLFVQPLLDKYTSSLFYRTFVIAFQQAILPRLTIHKNQPCNSSYTTLYRDPRNNSITWHYQKQFVFDIFVQHQNNSNFTLQLCDYRQGLICDKKSQTCQCPPDSAHLAISSGSSIGRCQLNKHEPCALIDLAHGNDPEHKSLAANLYHLVFNLERPPSCQPGYQCRFKDNDIYPKCHASDKGPFNNKPEMKSMGEPCLIGLYADSGVCIPSGGVGAFNSLVCYNYGTPRGLASTVEDTGRFGFCGPPFGPNGITHSYTTYQDRNKIMIYQYYPLFIPWVHPRNVPLRKELGPFYGRFLSEVQAHLIPEKIGEPGSALDNRYCTVAKTDLLETVWKWFASLGGPPQKGSDYVAEATLANLNDKLNQVVELGKGDNWKMKVCRIFGFRDSIYGGKRERLYCKVPWNDKPPPPHDGECYVGNDNVENDNDYWKWQEFLKGISYMMHELNEEEKNFDNKTLEEFPENECTPECECVDRKCKEGVTGGKPGGGEGGSGSGAKRQIGVVRVEITLLSWVCFFGMVF